MQSNSSTQINGFNTRTISYEESKMKVKIKSFKGELPDYLTVGKEYEVIAGVDSYGIAQIKTDDGYLCDIQLTAPSQRLNGGSWEVVE